MRLLLLTITTIIINWHQVNGQTKSLRSEYHPNGKLSSKGYDTCYSYNYKREEFKTCNGIGFWEYWYENGNKELEIIKNKTFRDSDSIIHSMPPKYVNMWHPDGKNILQNGLGLYYELQGDRNEYADSLVFQINDSIKHGKFERYRSYKYSPYFSVQSGQYENNYKTGLWQFKDSVLNSSEHSFYTNDKKNGKYKSFYINGKLKSEGQFKDDIKEGNWKYYNENEILIKECNYLSGRKFGKYSEYYPNGTIKVIGEFAFTSGKEIIYSPDLTSLKKVKSEVVSDKIVAMVGEWKYYNKNGRHIKTKKYNKKVKDKYQLD